MAAVICSQPDHQSRQDSLIQGLIRLLRSFHHLLFSKVSRSIADRDHEGNASDQQYQVLNFMRSFRTCAVLGQNDWQMASRQVFQEGRSIRPDKISRIDSLSLYNSKRAGLVIMSWPHYRHKLDLRDTSGNSLTFCHLAYNLEVARTLIVTEVHFLATSLRDAWEAAHNATVSSAL